MKKKIFGTMVAVVAMFASYSAYDAQNERGLTDVALANVEALAQSGESSSCTGGTANKHCPIWNIKTTTSWKGPTVECSTGGQWKCEGGTCPHGK